MAWANNSGSALRQAAWSRQFARAVIGGSSRPVSAGDAQGKPWGAAAPDEPGDLMPVDAVGMDLGQRSGDAQARELRHAPVVHGRLVAIDGLLAGDERFHRSSLSADGVALNGARAALPGNMIRIACSLPLLACEHRDETGEQASSDGVDSAGRLACPASGRPLESLA